MRFNDLPQIGSTDANGEDIFPLTDDSSGNDKKIKFKSFASWLLSVYNGLSLGGSARPVKDAIDDTATTANAAAGKVSNISWICCGAVTGVSPGANSYADFSITFPSEAPTTAPRVFAILRASSTSQTRSLIVPVVISQSATGATVRAFNNSTTAMSNLVFNWFALA